MAMALENVGGEGKLTSESSVAAGERMVNRKEKRKATKKEKRKHKRKELAEKARKEEDALLNDPEEQQRIQLEEERERVRVERERREFEERERLFLEALEIKRIREKNEEEERKGFEDEKKKQNQVEQENELNEDEGWEYVEEGPPEIIWQGNEIIVKRKKVRVKKKDVEWQREEEDVERPTSNPLPPQSEAFLDYKNVSAVSAQELLENVAQQIPNFGTEQDKAHCPFHLKTGACRFGARCSRVHFYPDKSCTLLMKNMYNGPGLTWEQDEGLECTDEDIEHAYEEFYEDVHTEFLKFGEIVNFKVCRNGSYHLRGNVYVHYKSLDSAVLAFLSVNGRYFAGKQVKCEFINVTKWKVAICGEFMKSRLKTCSHGSACNFIHCFRNPGGDYEWADWDKQPPKYWMKKMAVLFGYYDKAGYDKVMEHGKLGHPRNSSIMLSKERDRYRCKSPSSEAEYLDENSRWYHVERDLRGSPHPQHCKYYSRRQKMLAGNSDNEEHVGRRIRETTDSEKEELDRDRYGRVGCPRKRSRNQIKESGFQNFHTKRKSRAHQDISDDDHSFRNISESRSYRRSIVCQKEVTEGHYNFVNRDNRDQDVGKGEDWLEEERQNCRLQTGRRKGSTRRSQQSVSSDRNHENGDRSHDSDTREDWTDGDREEYHGCSKKPLKHSSQAQRLPDYHRGSQCLNYAHLQTKPDLEKSDHSGRKDCLGMDDSVDVVPYKRMKFSCDHNDSNSDRYGNIVGSCHIDSAAYDSNKNIDDVNHFEPDKSSKRHRKRKKSCSNDSFDSSSYYPCSERSKCHDCGYHSNEDVSERGRWEPDSRVSEEYQTSREKFHADDYEQLDGKHSSRDLKYSRKKTRI